MNEAELSALARRQRGYVTRKQLLVAGETRHSIEHAVSKGRLIPVHSGVYALGHVPVLSPDRAYGALLACGPEAALSHGTAGTAWGLFKTWAEPFEVTVQGNRCRRGIRIHRARLHRGDITTQLGLRVTSPALTLLDLASRLSDKALTRAVNDLRLAGYLRLPALSELLTRKPRHGDARRLAPFLQIRVGPTRSEFEDAFRSFTERYGLPTPQINPVIAGHEVDAFFPEEGVIVELDGWAFHSSRASFVSDRDRDATMLALGLITVRITWERLTETPDAEARRLHAILARRRNSYGPLNQRC